MTSLHMISLTVNLRELRRLAAVQGLEAGSRVGGDEGRALHHFLCESFGKSIVQPFRLMPGRNGARMGSLYAYTNENEENLRRTWRETAPPESANVFDLASLALKAMPKTWPEGRRLAFDIRLRPVRRLLKPIGNFTRKGAEIDAWLIEVLRQFPDGPPDNVEEKLRRDAVYAQWLAERLEGAANIETARMASVERTQTLRKGRSSHGPDVTFHGDLTITNGSKFAEKLKKGIGRHTAYGYGMLLLRPAPPREQRQGG